MLQIQHQITLKQTIHKGFLVSLALVLGLVGVVGGLQAAQAASSPIAYNEVPFTAGELTNWTTDRSVPSGGFASVSYAGRDNVLQMGIVGANRSTSGSFYYTEGLQRQIPTSSVAIKADVFVDSSWLATDVRTGLWGVGNDTLSQVSAYPIVEFTTAGTGDFTGWRSWDGVVGGWTNLPNVPYQTDTWNKVAIVLNDETQQFDVYINNTLATSSSADVTTKIGAVIINSYNYGSTSQDYTVRWSNFGYGNLAASPATKDACKNNGWNGFGFKNQGLCIQYVNTGKDSR